MFIVMSHLQPGADLRRGGGGGEGGGAEGPDPPFLYEE